MTVRHNLGPILALTAAGIALAAVIAGFIVTGGPGDARDRRLDELTTGRLMDLFNVVQCAYNGTGAAPASIEVAANVVGRVENEELPQRCNLGMPTDRLAASPGRAPSTPGAISYEVTGPAKVALCANFRRPAEAETCNGICGGRDPRMTIFVTDRPAGIHCYELELTQSDVAR